MSPIRDPRAGQDHASAPAKIALVGLRGSGKSTVGELLARELGRGFVDLDVEIERSHGAGRVGEILAQLGEPAFRRIESAALAEVLARPEPLVLACGGGTVIDAENRARLRACAWVAWLEAPPAELARRLASDPTPRPPLTPAGIAQGAASVQEIQAVLDARRAFLEEVSHLRIRTEGLSPEEVARMLRGGLAFPQA